MNGVQQKKSFGTLDKPQNFSNSHTKLNAIFKVY